MTSCILIGLQKFCLRKWSDSQPIASILIAWIVGRIRARAELDFSTFSLHFRHTHINLAYAMNMDYEERICQTGSALELTYDVSIAKHIRKSPLNEALEGNPCCHMNKQMPVLALYCRRWGKSKNLLMNRCLHLSYQLPYRMREALPIENHNSYEPSGRISLCLTWI